MTVELATIRRSASLGLCVAFALTRDAFGVAPPAAAAAPEVAPPPPIGTAVQPPLAQGPSAAGAAGQPLAKQQQEASPANTADLGSLWMTGKEALVSFGVGPALVVGTAKDTPSGFRPAARIGVGPIAGQFWVPLEGELTVIPVNKCAQATTEPCDREAAAFLISLLPRFWLPIAGAVALTGGAGGGPVYEDGYHTGRSYVASEFGVSLQAEAGVYFLTRSPTAPASTEVAAQELEFRTRAYESACLVNTDPSCSALSEDLLTFSRLVEDPKPFQCNRAGVKALAQQVKDRLDAAQTAFLAAYARCLQLSANQADGGFAIGVTLRLVYLHDQATRFLVPLNLEVAF